MQLRFRAAQALGRLREKRAEPANDASDVSVACGCGVKQLRARRCRDAAQLLLSRFEVCFSKLQCEQRVPPRAHEQNPPDALPAHRAGDHRQPRLQTSRDAMWTAEVHCQNQHDGFRRRVQCQAQQQRTFQAR